MLFWLKFFSTILLLTLITIGIFNSNLLSLILTFEFIVILMFFIFLFNALILNINWLFTFIFVIIFLAGLEICLSFLLLNL